MPITLHRKVRFTHPDYNYGGQAYAEYLIGAVGLKVNADIRLAVAWGIENSNMKFTAADDSIELLDGVTDFLSEGFRIGDTYVISNTASNDGTGTITDISDDGTIIYVDTALVDETDTSATIQGDKQVISFDFYPNLIENSVDFSLFNLTDRETVPHYYADTISTDSGNPTIMTVGSNSHGWVTPSDVATIYQSSESTTTNQIYIISHTFTITPLFIASQLANLQRLNPPAAGDFKDRFALKYVYTADAKFSALDPDIVHTTDGNVEFPKGQTGWFNEFVNGRPSKWTKESLLYSDNATGGGLTAIDYCKVVDVDAIMQCQDGVVETKYIVHVMYLPLNEDRYINTPTDYKTNFIYERAVVALGGTAQGENTGDYHFLKDVSCSSLDSTRVEFNFQIDFSSALVEFFDTQDSDNLNYLIFITASSNL